MSWVITPQLKSVDGVPVGTPYGGGYVAGFISHTADGNPTHALIVAPRATGATGAGYPVTTNLQWCLVRTVTTGATSVFDGVSNTTAILAAATSSGQPHPAAEFCANLVIAGFSDWYLPSRLELDIAYFNLKPTTAANNTTVGVNSYSVPARSSNYSASYPGQTGITLFSTGAEAFSVSGIGGNHWPSTESSVSGSFAFSLSSGLHVAAFKDTGVYPVRAFRRIAL